ncbi:CBS domain-containing protein [Streptomyces sp. NBC_01304]|uniref:CBS domain-containing protein n=1 Tax=Streptomyces sp. NBC_01304 TaxID=2903818 RepID=UPI002E0DC490|nr:CBS domain-containing protein [Streptomyces sp. NBC_01304]
MFAADLAYVCQTVELECDAVVAARMVAASPEPFLVLVESSGEPRAVLQAQELLHHLLPGSLAAQPGLISLSGPFAQAQLSRALSGRRVGDLLPMPEPPPTVTPRDRLSTVLLRLRQANSPVVVVIDPAGTPVRGIITAQRLLRRLLDPAVASASCGDDLHDAAAHVLTASRLLVAVSARSLAAVEETLTLLEFRLLVLLSMHGTLGPRHLAELLGVDEQMALRAVTDLQAGDLLAQSGNGGRDDLRLVLSPRGQDVVNDVMQRRTAEITQILEDMPHEDRTALAPALQSFARAAGEPAFGSPPTVF